MDIKKAVNKVKKDGVGGAYHAYKVRNAKALLADSYIPQVKKETKEESWENAEVYYRRLQAARNIRDSYIELGDEERAKKADAIVYMMETTPRLSQGKLTQINKDLKALQTGALNRLLRNKYIKEILPAEYQRATHDRVTGELLPVEDKVVFLQPRSGLNLSCGYMYDTLKKGGKYQLKLHEMYRMLLTDAERYLLALDFIRDTATAKAVFTHTFHDYYDYIEFRPETKIIQLWHGCGIIKKLGISNADTEGRRSSADYEMFNPYKHYDLVVMPSEEERWVFEDMMGLQPGDPVLRAIGVSRTDEFFDEEYKANCYKKLYKYIPQAEGKKLILYAPTYRGPDSGRYSPDKLDIEKFAEALGEDHLLLIKHHGTAKTVPEIPEKYRDSFAFDMTRTSGMDINEIMVVSDMIISDYSSVVFEFSLFERPIIYFMFDLDEYNDSHGMYYTYEELAEYGAAFKENDEMIDYIKHIDERFDKQVVIDFKNKFMNACDGHSTERIIQFFEGKE